MAETNAVTGSVQDLIGAAERANRRNVSNDLDKNAFLSLLVTQLRYQDPTNPMDNTAFISQMAQFSSLEQMQNINKTMESNGQFAVLAQASGFIGKQVTIQPPGDGSVPVTGVVDEVRQSSGKVTVLVGGRSYDVANIVQVMDKPAAQGTGT